MHTNATTVPEESGRHWATSKNVAESVLSRRPGVLGPLVATVY